jgi:hypothetical protein
MKKIIIVCFLLALHNEVAAQTLTITTANKSLNSFLGDVVDQMGYQNDIIGSANPVSKEEYGVAKITEYVAAGYNIDFLVPSAIVIKFNPTKMNTIISGFAYQNGYQDSNPLPKKVYSKRRVKKFIRDGYGAWKAKLSSEVARGIAKSAADEYTNDIEVE